jgi:hypothetical protein
MGAKLVNEVASKTSDLAGDGTTTATVLARAIFREGTRNACDDADDLEFRRSSLTWFVLTYLLGFGNVKNYDGSWLEWGNCVGVPIVKGAAPGGAVAATAAAAHAS